MPQSVEWDRDDVISLIRVFEERPYLWDVKCTGYKNRKKKQTGIKEIAVMFNRSPSEINRKWHNLRTQMMAEIRKIKTVKSLKLSRDYIPRWLYFDYLKFLDNPIESKDSTIEFAEVLLEDTKSEMKEEYSDEELSKSTFLSSSEKDMKPATKRQRRDEDLLLNCAKGLNSSNHCDEIFGSYVASVLKNLKHQKSKKKLRRIIQRAILDVEEEDSTDENVDNISNNSVSFSAHYHRNNIKRSN